MIKKVLLTIAIMSLAFGAYAQKTNVYIDSLTNVTLNFPSEVQIEKKSGFKQAEIETEKTIINVYSMANKKKRDQYTWDEVNNFDSDKTYGELIRYERAPRKLDGWIRYYSSKTKKGTPYTTCVVLIRGNNYAFYLTEAAYDEADLTIASLVENAEFPKSRRVSKKEEKIRIAILILMMILPFFFFKPLKKIKESIFWTICIIWILCCTGFYMFGISFDLNALYIFIFSGAVWLAIYTGDSWHDALSKALHAIGGAE